MWELYDLKTSNTKSFRRKAKEPKTGYSLPAFYCLDEAEEAIRDSEMRGRWKIRPNMKGR
jgi:hypothetical protein